LPQWFAQTPPFTSKIIPSQQKQHSTTHSCCKFLLQEFQLAYDEAGILKFSAHLPQWFAEMPPFTRRYRNKGEKRTWQQLLDYSC
jgi:hypothetical protein